MTTNIMHRGEFEKLAAKDKSTFCRSGGTITDRAAGATLTAAQVSTDKTLPRAAFSALSPSKKSAFAKAGGKLTD